MRVFTSNFSIEEFNAWSGAVDTIETIRKMGLIEQLEHYIDMIFNGECSDVELNDLLWHDRSEVYLALGLDENGEYIPTTEDKNEVIVDSLCIDTLPLYEEVFDMDDFDGEIRGYECEDDNIGYISSEFRDFIESEVDWLGDDERDELYKKLA